MVRGLAAKNNETRMTITDQQLRAWMIGSMDGSKADHVALMRALMPVLRRYFGRRMRGAEFDVDDLVQETLLAIDQRRASYDRNRPFSAWLFSIARYKMIDHYRRNRTLVAVDDVDDLVIIDTFEAEAGARLDVEKLLEILPPKQARAIRDTQLEGLTAPEAAAGAGIGESDVRVSVHRGLKAISNRLFQRQ
jgi:RNA polymerase sigma-70 factor (ECF subfamily)